MEIQTPNTEIPKIEEKCNCSKDCTCDKGKCTCRSKMWMIVSVILILILVAIIGVSLFLGMNKMNSLTKVNPTSTVTSTPPTTISSTPTVTPTITLSNALIFEKITTGATNSSTLSVYDINGNLVKTLPTSNPQSNTFNPGYPQSNFLMLEGSSLTLSNEKGTDWSVLEPDGTIIKVAPAVVSTLAKISSTGESIITIGKDTVLTSLISTNTDPSKYVSINLTTGTITTLLTFSTTDKGNEHIGYFPLRQFTLSKDHKKIYLLADTAMIDDTKIEGKAIINLDIENKTFTLNKLPVDVTMDDAVSNDGNLVTYSTAKVVTTNKINEQVFSLYIYNISTAKSILVENYNNLGVASGGHPYGFSPDGQYLYAHGNLKQTKGDPHDVTYIISSSTGKTIKTFDVGPYTSNLIQPIEWINDNTLVYETDTTKILSTFNGANDRTHTYNVATEKTFDFPEGIGGLMAVLKYIL